MKAAIYNSDGSIAVRNTQIVEPQAGWVRVAVQAVGICGSDIQIKNGALGSPEGMQPGHEIAGQIDSVADGVKFDSGTPVAIEPVHGCGTCSYCRSGKANICTAVQLFGVALPGGMAEFINVPAASLHPLPADLPFSVSALSEPMAVCVRGLRRANIKLGARVAILGAGTIGLVSILAARSAGASEVHVSARHSHQQELARHLGATGVYSDVDTMLAELGDQYIDTVVETVGANANTLAESVMICRNGGSVVSLGVFKGNPQIPGLPFFLKELTLVASNCYAHDSAQGDFEAAISLVGEHRDLLENLVTHRVKLDEIDKAFAISEDKKQRSIKVQVNP